jgi:hypothetical protein
MGKMMADAMRRVIIESPYAADTEASAVLNKAYALECLRDCLRRGEAPFASHVIYTLVLHDSFPADRQLGINAGLAWGEVADATVVYQDYGISPGMKLGIAHAERCGRVVEYRRLSATKAMRMQHHEFMGGDATCEDDVA